MEQALQDILAHADACKGGIESRADLEKFKAEISGPKGSLTQAMKGMGKLPKEERPIIGKKINETKKALDAIFETIDQFLEEKEIQDSLGEPIDPTLPSPDPEKGSLHPLTQVRRRMTDIFSKIGFTVAEEFEAETEWFCFDALNTPDDHPARDEQDTLFLSKGAIFKNVPKKENERYLLRTHTSTVQIRTMLKTKPPIRIIAPGRCFRRDTVDATHSANFHQFEGLYLDENVTLQDLKSVLDHLIKELFGNDVKTRLRPSFFPFTEPSYELDLNSPSLGKLSNQWIEVMGCGMVDPKVLESVEISSDKWNGFAFGVGIERIAMMLYGIDDIRHFYQNDLRFLKQFA